MIFLDLFLELTNFF